MRDTISTLQGERARVAAQLDTIDLALTNLQRLYEDPPSAPAIDVTHLRTEPAATLPIRRRRGKKASTKKTARARAARVVRTEATPEAAPTSPASSSDAQQRRELLLGFITKSEVGLTMGELRARAPKIDPKDLNNALQTLKTKKQLRRAGNSWVAV